jgi:hypothetical protein
MQIAIQPATKVIPTQLISTVTHKFFFFALKYLLRVLSAFVVYLFLGLIIIKSKAASGCNSRLWFKRLDLSAGSRVRLWILHPDWFSFSAWSF